VQVSAPLHAAIPACREAASIGRVIQGILSLFPGAGIIVVDDGSVDGTGTAALHAGAKVVRMPFISGYGVALQTGLRWAAQHGARCVVTLDADGRHDPRELSAIMEPVLSGRADIAIGSRDLAGGAPCQAPLARRLGAWACARLVSALTRRRITGATSGFQCLNAVAIRLYADLEDFPEIAPDADMLLYAHLRGLRICKVPVSMYADEGQESIRGLLRSFFYVPLGGHPGSAACLLGASSGILHPLKGKQV
jgi:glycosyltransferase involved in cell wall biosynthesis